LLFVVCHASSRSPYHCPVSSGSSVMFPLVEDPTAIQAFNFDPRCPNVLEDVYRFATFLCAYYCLCILYNVYLDVDTYLMHNVTCFKILWVLLCSCLRLHECFGGEGVVCHISFPQTHVKLYKSLFFNCVHSIFRICIRMLY
jgi:hypothetical protein